MTEFVACVRREVRSIGRLVLGFQPRRASPKPLVALRPTYADDDHIFRTVLMH